MIALRTPNFCRKSSHGMRFHRILQRTTSSWTSSKPVPAKKEKEFFTVLRKSYNIDNLSPANIKFGGSQQVTVRGEAAEFRQFLAREAQCDDECWMCWVIFARVRHGLEQRVIGRAEKMTDTLKTTSTCLQNRSSMR